MSQLRQQFNAECEEALNKQINIVLQASYAYLSMACSFERDDVALGGFHKFFKSSSDKFRAKAEQIMNYQNLRGGRVSFREIPKPQCDYWNCPVEALQASLDLEKNINQTFLDLQKLSERHEDAQMCDWVVQHFIPESVERIEKISSHVTNMKRVGPGLGHYVFDEEAFD